MMKYDETKKPNLFAIQKMLILLFKDKEFKENKIPKDIIKYFKKQ